MRNFESALDQSMQIVSHDVTVQELHFNAPVHLPFGTIRTRPSVWLEVSAKMTDNQEVQSGAAEGTALPMQIPMYDDYSGNLKDNVDFLMEPFYDRDEFTIRDVVSNVRDTELYGTFSTARMTVETAFIDLIARANDTTVFGLITDGKTPPKTIPYGKSIAELDLQKNFDAGQKAFENGAKRLKFKVSPTNAHEVMEAITRLRSTRSDGSFMVDANGSFDPNNDADIEILKHIDGMGLMMIEEPVSRAGETTGLAAHFVLRDKLKLETPVALDDSIASEVEAQIALKEGVGDILNLKPGRVGSFLRCIEMAHLAKDMGKQIMVGGMYEATPGRSMTLTLAAYCLSLGFTIPGDVSLPQERLIEDLVEPILRHDANHDIVFEPQIGWGYTL